MLTNFVSFITNVYMVLHFHAVGVTWASPILSCHSYLRRLARVYSPSLLWKPVVRAWAEHELNSDSTAAEVCWWYIRFSVMGFGQRIRRSWEYRFWYFGWLERVKRNDYVKFWTLCTALGRYIQCSHRPPIRDQCSTHQWSMFHPLEINAPPVSDQCSTHQWWVDNYGSIVPLHVPCSTYLSDSLRYVLQGSQQWYWPCKMGCIASTARKYCLWRGRWFPRRRDGVTWVQSVWFCWAKQTLSLACLCSVPCWYGTWITARRLTVAW